MMGANKTKRQQQHQQKSKYSSLEPVLVGMFWVTIETWRCKMAASVEEDMLPL